jgi:hypothetical protein
MRLAAQRHGREGDMMRFRHVLTALLLGVAVLAAPGVATAAYPGANGRIAFEQGGVIYSIRPTGPTVGS